MKRLLSLALLTSGLAAQPPSKPVTPSGLPAPIEIRSSSALPQPASRSGPIELTPHRGEVLERMSVQGRVPWFGGYELPAGPGRAWPNAAPPGASVPAGGLLTPGFPGR
jgi:hypothetical protein